jgi:hypothetical protein
MELLKTLWRGIPSTFWNMFTNKKTIICRVIAMTGVRVCSCSETTRFSNLVVITTFACYNIDKVFWVAAHFRFYWEIKIYLMKIAVGCNIYIAAK